MAMTHLQEDIRPLSEFRANAAELIEKVREKKRALVLTQRGRSSAVVLDVGEYQRLLEEVELLRDLATASKQLDRGEGVSHAQAKNAVLTRIRPAR